MIKKFISISLMAIFLLLSSCADDELSPIITFDKAGKGAYAKLITETIRVLDFDNPGSAEYAYTVEFVDEDQGNTVTNYNITVSYVDNDPDNGDNSASAVDLKSFSSGEFTTTQRGFKAMEVTITLNELLSAFGLSIDQLSPKDEFEFVTTVNTSGGGTFGASNSSAAVNGTAFAGHFNYDLEVNCPLPDNLFVGKYELSYDGDASAGLGVPFEEGVVDITVNTTTRRNFDAKWSFGKEETYEVGFEVVCDHTEWESFNPDEGCSGESIIIDPDTDFAPIISLTDDSVIKINIIDTAKDGGCGADPSPKTIVLTRM